MAGSSSTPISASWSADRAEDRFGIALLEAREQEHRFEVGTQTEEVAGRDLTGHDRFLHVRLPEKLNSFPSWPTRSHSISSARLVMSAEVSSVNAATMIFFTPAMRAASASRSG